MRAWLGNLLRTWADRIDYDHSFVYFPAHFNFVRYEGIVITQTEGIMVYPEAPGTPLFYRVSDYSRAFEPLPDQGERA